jgi:hypothetical protein
VLTIEQLAARLAGGFLRPVDRDTVQMLVAEAMSLPLGDLDSVKLLPGFRRAAATSLTKAWNAGLSISEEVETASDAVAKTRLASLSLLEQAVLAKLPKNQLRPREMMELAIKRAALARAIFGRIEIHGATEVSSVWRPLLATLAKHTDVIWVADARHTPEWVEALDIHVTKTPATKPVVRTVSCATPRHEILEAFRWARQHLSRGVPPQNIAIVTAAPDEWDDYVLSLEASTNVPVHFVHGRAALSTLEGQLAAALAEILLRGFSRRRLVRFVGLLRSQSTRFQELPSNWWYVLPDDAPLLDAARWTRLIESLTAESFSDATDHRSALREIVDSLSKGLAQAGEIGEGLLQGKALIVWRKALSEGPPAALDVTLTGLRVNKGLEPEASLVWGPASAIAAVPRPFVWLLGLTSRSWPRRASEDPLLSNHVIASDRFDPLPIQKIDTRDFLTIGVTTAQELVCSRARRDGSGRLCGKSPLYPRGIKETYYTQTREPAHAASPSDRLLARSDEFAALPNAVSAIRAWKHWHQPAITCHDGLVRADHPVLHRAINRRQSATSLVKLLRDPIGYLWTYGFNWRSPEESDEPMMLDALAFGSLLHELLEKTVIQLEAGHPKGFAGASISEIKDVVDNVVGAVDALWTESRPVPPPVLWKRKLQEAAELAITALSYHDEPFQNERSWTEVPFGGDQKASALTEEALKRLPWDPLTTVTIPGTILQIGGSIDRLDIAGDGSRARVTDYKSGKVGSKLPQLKGGAELQRCLYAFAVKVLISNHPQVEAQLLYPKRDGSGLPLEDPEGTLDRLKEYLIAATTTFLGGAALPGPAANEDWYDLAFALPGGAKEKYLATKFPLVTESLAVLAPLWGEP